MGNSRKVRFTLFTFGVCGLVGILIDIDHVITYYLLRDWSGRFLHTPLLVASGIVLCGLSAYLGGLLIRVVLK